MPKTYTIGQIQDLYDYLNECVKNGSMDEEVANEIVDNQDWEKAEAITNLGDEQANLMNQHD